MIRKHTKTCWFWSEWCWFLQSCIENLEYCCNTIDAFKFNHLQSSFWNEIKSGKDGDVWSQQNAKISTTDLKFQVNNGQSPHFPADPSPARLFSATRIMHAFVERTCVFFGTFGIYCCPSFTIFYLILFWFTHLLQLTVWPVIRVPFDCAASMHLLGEFNPNETNFETSQYYIVTYSIVMFDQIMQTREPRNNDWNHLLSPRSATAFSWMCWGASPP